MQGALPITPDLLASPFRFLWHIPTRTAILSDLHLGGEVSLAHAGIALPDVYFPRLLAAWQRIVSANPRHIILAGDVFDAPHLIDRSYLDALLQSRPHDCQVSLTPGNHDPDPIHFTARFPFVSIQPWITLDPYIITHGHQMPQPRPAGILIVGHQHPAVTFNTRVHSAKMLCFAHTPNLIILPAFSPLPLGSNLLTARHWILDFPRPADAALRIAGIIEKPGAEQVLDFGPLAHLA